MALYFCKLKGKVKKCEMNKLLFIFLFSKCDDSYHCHVIVLVKEIFSRFFLLNYICKLENLPKMC